MRRIKNSIGWEEITTVNIDISRIVIDYVSNETWNRINEKNPKLGRNRKTCKCCGSKWDSNGSPVALAFTNKGNKPICQDCVDYFITKNIPIIRKPLNENE